MKKIIDEVFTNDVTQAINQQEYIGMRLSGGIDSALLCFLIMTKFPDKKVMPITMYNKIRPAAANSVNKVREVLKKLNPNSILVEPEIGYFDTTGFEPTKQMKENFKKFGRVAKYNPKDIFQNKWFDTLFDKYNGKLNFLCSGETLNPPLDVQDQLVKHREFPSDRNKKAPRLLSKWSYKKINRYEFRPWRNKTKKEVSLWTKQLGLMDTLFPVTESCELETIHYERQSKEFNIKYTNVGVEPCRRCWPCREKWWAYGYYDFMTEED